MLLVFPAEKKFQQELARKGAEMLASEGFQTERNSGNSEKIFFEKPSWNLTTNFC